MTLSPAGTIVALPGTGTSAAFMTSVFSADVRPRGWRLRPVDPAPGRRDSPSAVGGGRTISRYLAALTEAAGHGPYLIAGVSLGAQVAVRWAARLAAEAQVPGPEALWCCLPAWTGAPRQSPAALSARLTADLIAQGGVEFAIAQMRAGSPPWLAEILTTAWRGWGDGLEAHFRESAEEPGPRREELRAVTCPVGIAAATDDPIHPLAVAELWAAELPHASLAAISLAEVGISPSALGDTAARQQRRALRTTGP